MRLLLLFALLLFIASCHRSKQPGVPKHRLESFTDSFFSATPNYQDIYQLRPAGDSLFKIAFIKRCNELHLLDSLVFRFIETGIAKDGKTYTYLAGSDTGGNHTSFVACIVVPVNDTMQRKLWKGQSYRLMNFKSIVPVDNLEKFNLPHLVKASYTIDSFPGNHKNVILGTNEVIADIEGVY